MSKYIEMAADELELFLEDESRHWCRTYAEAVIKAVLREMVSSGDSIEEVLQDIEKP